jgi:hypothetical protein
MTSTEHEALRQHMLVRVLWREAEPDELRGWLRQPAAAAGHGLAAYRGNAGAIAERALAGAYPTVAALVGDEAFAALARDFWQHDAPERGDLGEWGATLPDFIAASAALASEPYLADSARLDWCVHQATRAADAPAAPPALDALAGIALETLRLRLRPGCALLTSTWPVAAIWQAHQSDAPDRFDDVRAAFAAGRGDHAFVWRDGFAVQVDALDGASAAFTRSVLGGASLADALDAAGDGFAFDQWLARALRQRWLVALQPMEIA